MVRFRMCVLTTVPLAVICGQGPAGAAEDVVINELMASNGATLRDGQGQYDDWVELYNASDTPVDIGGMYLTDDLSRPTRWNIWRGMGTSMGLSMRARRARSLAKQPRWNTATDTQT